jgi:TPR repeat protein
MQRVTPRGCSMSVKYANYFLLIFSLSLTNMPVLAAGLDDADERLFQVQLSLAEKGDVRAQYFLGEMHEQGLGTKQDIEEAYKWYEKAAEQGDAWAKRKIAHRAEMEAETKKEQTTNTLKPAPVSRNANDPAKPLDGTGRENPAVVMAQTNSRAEQQETIKDAEKEKRRAAVRAMILERLRHPVGEPFE